MLKVNPNYAKLPGSYLFAEIARRVNEYAAQNPGTCVYYTEMWEAVLMDPKQASTSHDCYGDFSGMRY